MGREWTGKRYALYLFHYKAPDDEDPLLMADMDTLAEAFEWMQTNGPRMRRHMQPNGTFIELLDWTQGATIHWLRVG